MYELGWYFQYFSIFGVGIHVIIAVFFAIHAIKNGQPFFWLWVLFVFPFLGSVVYFVAIYLPYSRMPYHANAFTKKALHVLQPNRGLNKAKETYENLPSVDNAVHYAELLIASERANEAITILKTKLNGFVEKDCIFLEQLATAYLQDKKAQDTLDITSRINSINPQYKSEKIALLRALSFHQLNQQEDARNEFRVAIRSREIGNLAEYALWAIQTGQIELAKEIRAEMQKNWNIGTKYSRQLHKPIYKQLDQSLKQYR